jgi:hypothetical protein
VYFVQWVFNRTMHKPTVTRKLSVIVYFSCAASYYQSQ